MPFQAFPTGRTAYPPVDSDSESVSPTGVLRLVDLLAGIAGPQAAGGMSGGSPSSGRLSVGTSTMAG